MAEPTLEQSIRLKRWRVSTFWVMLLGYIGYYIIRGNLPVALPLLSQTFGYTNTQLGMILTFSELAYALGKFTTGPLADHIGGKRIFMLGMIGGIVFNFLFPLSTGLVYFTVIWCFARYFLAMGWGGIIKIIGEWYEPERNGTVMGMISVNFQFGAAIASFFAGYLVAVGVGWRGLFYIPASLISVCALISYFACKERPSDVVPDVCFGKLAGRKSATARFANSDGTKVSALGITKHLFKVPLFRQVLTFGFLAHFVRSFFLFWIPKFMVDMGMGNVNAALTSAVFPFVGAFGTIALGWYTDHYAPNGDRAGAMWKMLIGLALSLLAIAFLVPYRLEYSVAIVVLIGVAGLCLNGPYSMSAGCLSLDIAGPEGAGTCTGLIDGIGYISGAIASWAAGFIADRFGWQEVYFLLAGCATIAVLWTYYMSWYARNRAARISTGAVQT